MTFLCSLLLLGVPQDPDVRESVVKILATQRRPDLTKPWTKESPREISGSGVVIEGKRILTNAHVVTHVSQVYVQGYQSADKIAATVVAVAPGIDLAVLQVEDESFFEKRPAVPMAPGVPKIRDTVNVYGYPTGGTALSVTEGIVSRVEHVSYKYDTSGLRIQVDAALNPGNSGGPAVAGGKVVGLVFSGLRSADNIGYLIPVEEIAQMLEDVKDGSFDGKPEMFDAVQPLENRSLREKLGLAADVTGVMVTTPAQSGEGYPLKEWDVITDIGGYDIENDGKIKVGDDLRLWFTYAVPKVSRDGSVPLTVLREGKRVDVKMPVAPTRNTLVRYLKERYPRYFLYGPLVFSPACAEFVAVGARMSGFGSRVSPLLARASDPPRVEGEELVVVTSLMLPHRITKGYEDPFGSVLTQVDGVEVKNLRHLVELLRDGKDPFVVFKFADPSRGTIVFRREEVRNATEEILTDNGIRHQCSEDLRDLWK